MSPADEAAALWRELLAEDRVAWRDGMLVEHDVGGSWPAAVRLIGSGPVTHFGKWPHELASPLPDFHDGPTRGALLDMAREAVAGLPTDHPADELFREAVALLVDSPSSVALLRAIQAAKP